MGFSEEKKLELIDLVDRLAELGQDDLQDHFTTENIQSLRKAAELIKGNMTIETAVSTRRFVQVVLELSEAKGIWSGKWDQTLQQIGELIGEGEGKQALMVLRGFIRFCPSPYYRGEAEAVLRELKDDRGTED